MISHQNARTDIVKWYEEVIATIRLHLEDRGNTITIMRVSDGDDPEGQRYFDNGIILHDRNAEGEGPNEFELESGGAMEIATAFFIDEEDNEVLVAINDGNARFDRSLGCLHPNDLVRLLTIAEEL
jgi:hypothetical protein